MKNLDFYKDLQEKMVSFAVYSNYLVVFPVYPKPLPYVRNGLTINDYVVVWNLIKKDCQKMSDIASANNIKAYQMSRIAKKLVKKGYVNRYNKDNNRKTMYLELTDKGKSFAEENIGEQASRFKNNLENVADESEIKKFDESYDFLLKMYQKLNSTL